MSDPKVSASHQKMSSAITAFFGFASDKDKEESKSASKKSKKKIKHPGQLPSTDIAISGPSLSPKEGLYRKLTAHQEYINTRMDLILTSLGQQKDRKTNYSVMFTDILLQLSGVVSTTQQCLTKDIYEKNASVKFSLSEREREMYVSVALLVKWADFGNRDERFQMEVPKVQDSIDRFRDAINEIVVLVAENVLDQSRRTLSVAEKGRRKSFDSSYLHRVDGGEGVDCVDGNGDSTSHLNPATRSFSVKPRLVPINRDSLNSDSSTSGDSDVNRRSGSLERQDNAFTENSNMRIRGKVEPEYPAGSSYPRPHPPHIPLPPPPAPSSPPRDRQNTPPRMQSENGVPPPLPMRKHVSPVHKPYKEQVDLSASLPSRQMRFPVERPDRVSLPTSNAPSLDQGDVPPPLPMKKGPRRQLGHMSSYPVMHPPDMNTHSPGGDGDSTPPPIPIKKSRQGSLPISSLTSSSLPPSFLNQLASTGEVGLDGSAPRPPMRMESIPALRPIITAAHTATTPPAPPKPPRSDRVVSGNTPTLSLPQAGPELLSAVKRIEEYNVNVKKASVEPGAAPPIPPKKRTVMMYNQLIQMQDYKFDESIYQPFNIRGVDIPPPVPPKRRTARRTPSIAGADKVQLRNPPADGTYAVPPGVPDSSQQTPSQQPLQSGEAKRAISGSTEELSSEELEDEKINYLEVEKASAYLVFNKEEEGLYTLRGGPIDALIAYAASTTNDVSQYPEAFLLTYYTFITPEELVDKLIYRLRYFYGEGNSTVWQATTSLLVRLLTNLRLPLQKEAEIKLIELVHSMLTDGNLKFAQLVRNALVDKLNQLIPNGINDIPFGKALSTTTSRATIQDFEPEEIAVQMTVLDAELFYKVDVSEMFYWAKEQSEEKSPRLTQFTMHFNNVSQWCRTKLLERDLTLKQREKLMMLLIQVMKALRVHNNFNSYLAILSAIESAPISRLDWSEKITRSLEEPRALIDSRGSFKNYRQAFAQTKPPCIPYIGLYLQDLTSLEEQPSKLEDGVSINFGKRWKQFKSVDHIRFAQSRQYNYPPDPKIFGVFNNFEVHSSDEELWKVSLEIKPSARQRAAAQ